MGMWTRFGALEAVQRLGVSFPRVQITSLDHSLAGQSFLLPSATANTLAALHENADLVSLTIGAGRPIVQEAVDVAAAPYSLTL